MALNFQRFYNGITIQPQNTTAPSIKGDLRYNSATDKLELFNGSVDPIVTEADTATLTNKTLTGNTASSFVNGSGTLNINSSGTVTVPNATDTLVGKNTTDTLTNKTIAAGSNTITGLTNTNLSGSAAITNANLASMAANTAKANITGSPATPSDVSAVSTATASSFMVRDANANVSINNITQNYTTTATAAGTTNLLVSSSYFQYFTGSTTQTVKLPDATTLPQTGWQVRIVNLSSGNVTIQDNGGSSQQVMAANTVAQFTAKSVATANGSWDTVYTSTSVTATGTNTGDVTLAAVGSSPNANAASLSGQVLNLQPFNSSFPGVTPASGGGTTNFLRADATWATPTATPSLNFTSQSSNYAASVGDYVYATNTLTVTLPTAVSQSGKLIAIEFAATSLNSVVTINTTSSQTVGGIASGTYKLNTAKEVLEVISDGSNWQITKHNTDTGWVTGATTGTITGTTTNPTKGTVVTDQIYWKRVGDSAHIRLNYYQSGTGSAGSGDYVVPLPSSMVIDTTLAPIQTTPTGNQINTSSLAAVRIPATGSLAVNASNNGNVANIVPFSSTSFRVEFEGGVNGYWGSAAGQFSAVIGVSIEFIIPISTWQP